MASSLDFGLAATEQASVPRDAATVLLLRDAPGGFEVFMVKRSGLSDVLGEAHVFPGGKIDAPDHSLGMLARIHGLAELDTAALGEDLPAERAAGMFAAAARETFEEAGVLLAQGVTGDLPAAGLQAARAPQRQGAIRCCSRVDQRATQRCCASTLGALGHAGDAGEAIRRAFFSRDRAA